MPRASTFAQARHELQQFSVFAAQFDVAQAKLVANAPTPEAYEERLKVLLNEKGIPYEHGFEGELTGHWSMETVHFTWLRKMAAALELQVRRPGQDLDRLAGHGGLCRCHLQLLREHRSKHGAGRFVRHRELGRQ